MTVASGRRPDAGALVPQQQGDGLELRAHGRRHAAAPGSRLDLTHGPGEHRDDAAAVADASLLLRAVRRAPAWRWPGRATDFSSGMPGHGGHGSMPHSPAAGARNVPGTGPGASNAEPTCGSRRIDAAGLDKRLTRTRSRRLVGW